MLTIDVIAALLAASPGPLPSHARRLVLDVASGRTPAVAMSRLVIRVLQRSDITLDEAREVYATAEAHGPLETREVAAWLARPEHDLHTLPDLVVTEAHRTAERVDELVAELLAQPLCRPQVALTLATADEPTLTSAVAAATVERDIFDIAVRHTDWLLTPDVDAPPKRCPEVPVETLSRAFGNVAAVEPGRVAAWCRRLRTVPLILAAAAWLAAPDEVTAAHAVRAGVLPTLASKMTGTAGTHVNAVIVRARRHLDQATRLEIADAIDTGPNAGRFDYLTTLAASLRIADGAQPLRTVVYGAGDATIQEATARQLLAALGDDEQAWRVLRATVPSLADTATVSDVIAVTTGISHDPDRGRR